MTDKALSLRGLTISLRQNNHLRPLVQDVNLELAAGTITGLAGESGCGKSLTALALLGLHSPRQLQVSYESARLGARDLPLDRPAAMRPHRGRDLAMVFQDPAAALDPVFTVGAQLGRALQRAAGTNRREARLQTLDALAAVGFPEPAEVAGRYPFELSGGMRQLCLIAMARALEPRVLIADEPTTALDASTQALILEQLLKLGSDRGTAILLITHDLRLLTRHANAVSIMYHGRIIEETTGPDLFRQPAHPYTRGLLDALPDPHRKHAGKAIPGQVPAALTVLPGCAFSPRCNHATARCRDERPTLQRQPAAGALLRVACHHPLEPRP